MDVYDGEVAPCGKKKTPRLNSGGLMLIKNAACYGF